MTVTLGMKEWGKAEPVVEILNKYHPVDQQKILEICVARHVMHVSMTDAAKQQFVIDSISKHVRQLIESLR